LANAKHKMQKARSPKVVERQYVTATEKTGRTNMPRISNEGWPT